MTANLPATFDSLIFDAEITGRQLQHLLREIADYSEQQLRVSQQSEPLCEHDQQRCVALAVRLRQAIGMAEGVNDMLESIREQRPRCLS